MPAKVMRLESVFASLTFLIAPLFVTPVPLMVMASPTLTLLLKFSAPPDKTVVVPAVAPKALLCAAFIAPALM